MFTGIIKAKGSVAAMHHRQGDLQIVIVCDALPWGDFSLGESIAVNGVCLTAVELNAAGFAADVSLETLQVTALKKLSVGSTVNLEPAVSLGERLGGHLVSGHVDCIGEVAQRRGDGRSIRLSISIPEEFARYVAKKGSICVDGVSLTVNEVKGRVFELNIIPHTAHSTIIDGYNVGSIVNIEVDLLARYLERLMSDDRSGISQDFLKAHGYVK